MLHNFERFRARRPVWTFLVLSALIGGAVWLVLRQKKTPVNPVSPHNAQLTAAAQLFGGIEPKLDGFEHLQLSDEWKAHQEYWDRQWAVLERDFLRPAAEWRNREIGYKSHAPKVLLYPFGGADFLNGYFFFPYCDNYVLFGPMAIGDTFRLEYLSSERIAPLLSHLDRTLTDFLRGADRLGAREPGDPSRGGAVPFLLALMGRMNMKIVDVEHVEILEGGSVVASSSVASRTSPPVSGVRISFKKSERDILQNLMVFNADGSDVFLTEHPEFGQFIEGLQPTNTMIKSSGYVLQMEKYRMMQQRLLAVTNVLLQDDSGIPFGVFAEWAEWIRLYGRYPVADGGQQAELRRAYAEGPVRPLGFGVSARGCGNFSNLMLVVRDLNDEARKVPPQRQ